MRQITATSGRFAWGVGVGRDVLKYPVERFLLICLAVDAYLHLFGELSGAVAVPSVGIAYALIFSWMRPFQAKNEDESHYLPARVASSLLFGGVFLALLQIIRFLKVDFAGRIPLLLPAEDNAAWYAISSGQTAPAWSRGISSYVHLLIDLSTTVTFSVEQVLKFDLTGLERATLATSVVYLCVSVAVSLRLLRRSRSSARCGNAREDFYSVFHLIWLLGSVFTFFRFGHLTAALTVLLVTRVIALSRETLSPSPTDYLRLALACTIWKPMWFLALIAIALAINVAMESSRRRITGAGKIEQAERRKNLIARAVWASIFVLAAAAIPEAKRLLAYSGGTPKVQPGLLLLSVVFLTALAFGKAYDRSRIRLPVLLLVYALGVVAVDYSFHQRSGYGSQKVLFVAVATAFPYLVLEFQKALNIMAKAKVPGVVSAAILMTPVLFDNSGVVEGIKLLAGERVTFVTEASEDPVNAWRASPWIRERGAEQVSDEQIVACTYVRGDGLTPLARFDGYLCTRIVGSIGKSSLPRPDGVNGEPFQLFRAFGMGNVAPTGVVARLANQSEYAGYRIAILDTDGSFLRSERLIDYAAAYAFAR